MVTPPAPNLSTDERLQDGSAGTDAMNAIKFRIPADTIHQAAAKLDDRARAAVLWLGGYCRQHNLSREEVGSLLRKPGTASSYYSYDSIYQLLTGRRTADGVNLTPMIEVVEKLRSIEAERLKVAQGSFVETALYDLIRGRCRKALLRQRIVFIFGDSQIGKTASLLEYTARNNHGETTYVEAPARSNLGNFLRSLAVALGISAQQSIALLRERIIDCFDARRLLIIDEAHRLINEKGSTSMDSLDFARELWNRKKCGIVLSMTNEGRDNLLRGRHAKSLQQLWRRRIQPLQLPAVPPPADLALFAAQYGLQPASDDVIGITFEGKTFRSSALDVQDTVIKEDGLGVWISILQDAADLATDAGRPMGWGAVLKAYCMSRADETFS